MKFTFHWKYFLLLILLFLELINTTEIGKTDSEVEENLVIDEFAEFSEASNDD